MSLKTRDDPNDLGGLSALPLHTPLHITVNATIEVLSVSGGTAHVAVSVLLWRGDAY